MQTRSPLASRPVVGAAPERLAQIMGGELPAAALLGIWWPDLALLAHASAVAESVADRERCLGSDLAKGMPASLCVVVRQLLADLKSERVSIGAPAASETIPAGRRGGRLDLSSAHTEVSHLVATLPALASVELDVARRLPGADARFAQALHIQAPWMRAQDYLGLCGVATRLAGLPVTTAPAPPRSLAPLDELLAEARLLHWLNGHTRVRPVAGPRAAPRTDPDAAVF